MRRLAAVLYIAFSMGVLAIFSLEYWEMIPQSSIALFLLMVHVGLSLVLFFKAIKVKPSAILQE